jgi:hypothetical protein
MLYDLTEDDRVDDADYTAEAAREAEALRSRVYDAQHDLDQLLVLNDTDYEGLDEIHGKLQAMAELAGDVASILNGIEQEAAQRLSDHEDEEED